MRNRLGKFFKERRRFKMTFIRIGKKMGGKRRDKFIRTALCVDIFDKKTGKEVCDHLWFNYLKQFSDLSPKSGDIIELDGRIDEYQKGYSEDDEEKPFQTDFHIRNPTHFERVGHAEGDFTQSQALSDKINRVIEEFENRRISELKNYYAKKYHEVSVKESHLETLLPKEDRNLPQNKEVSKIPEEKTPKKQSRNLLDFMKHKS